MRLSGTLRSWNDERGFGLIAPTHGGAELLVHISALPSDGSRPTTGEKLSYELGRGRNGQPQAVKVRREAIGDSGRRAGASRTQAPRDRSRLSRIALPVLLLALLALGIDRYRQATTAPKADDPQPLTSTAEPHAPPAQPPASFRCDGRTHCSQMSSCAEAKYFLRNCPGTQMDGNNDGVPCQQQWCTSPFAE